MCSLEWDRSEVLFCFGVGGGEEGERGHHRKRAPPACFHLSQTNKKKTFAVPLTGSCAPPTGQSTGPGIIVQSDRLVGDNFRRGQKPAALDWNNIQQTHSSEQAKKQKAAANEQTKSQSDRSHPSADGRMFARTYIRLSLTSVASHKNESAQELRPRQHLTRARARAIERGGGGRSLLIP